MYTKEGLNICKSKNVRIGVDIDGVICDTREKIVEVYNKEFALDYSGEDLKDYYLENTYGKGTYSVFKKFEWYIYNESQPIKWAKKVLDKLSLSIKLYFITARPKEFQEVTSQWLIKHDFPTGCPVIYTRNKGRACLNYNINMFIEDHPKYATDVTKIGVPVLLFDQPYNREFSNSDTQRVYNWLDIYNILHQFEEESFNDRTKFDAGTI